MTRATARGRALVLVLLGGLAAFAPPGAARVRPGIVQPPLGTDAMRRLALNDPRAMIHQAQFRLDDPSLPAATERGLLWWMGSAALNLNDDAALTESVLRLDSLYRVRHDPLAGAAARYLRAFHQILGGDASGLGTALRAAALVQATRDARVRAWSRYELCDAYTQVGEPAKAQPICRQAAADARTVGDAWELADDENDLAWNDSARHHYQQAIAMYHKARARFEAIGAGQVAAQVGDNLAHTLIAVGRPREALRLSRASLVHEQAAGRESDALLSRANIARAYAAQHAYRRAEKVTRAAIAEARKTSNQGLLPTLYSDDSRYAEAAGDLKRALASARAANAGLRKENRPSALAAEKILEENYAARERDLRIRDLERENRVKAMALKVAKARTERETEARRREQLLTLGTLVAALALLAIATLLYLLLRAQRRHAEALRMLALKDPLTGVDNRRAFMRSATQLFDALTQAPEAVHALLLIDLDHFKRVNDSVGHPAGDRVLVDVVREIERASEGIATLSRLGGEEFALLCLDMDRERAVAFAGGICQRIANMPLPLPADAPIAHVTVSIGVALIGQAHCRDIESLLRSADRALYEAKSGGRNRVAVAP